MQKPVGRFRAPIHPGAILKEDLMEPYGLSMNQLAKDLKIPANRISQIIRGKRAVSADTSIRLGRYFGFSPGYWHNMQKHFEFECVRRSSQAQIEKQIRPREAA